MSDRQERMKNVRSVEGTDHTLAVGLVAGAVGIGLGLLFAPRRGSEMRHQVAVQMNHLVTHTANGYVKATHSAGGLAHRSHDMYADARTMVARRAHDAQRYVREITEAVTTTSRRQSGTARLVPVSIGQPPQLDAQAIGQRPPQANIG